MSDKTEPIHQAFNVQYPSYQDSITTPCTVINSFDLKLSYEARALWDTGATHSVIHPRIAHKLNLRAVDKTMVQGVHGSEEVNVYIVNIELPNKITAFNVVSTGANIGDEIDVLIGMDIIGAGDFAICDSSFFSFATPTFKNPVDFVEKANEVNSRKKRNK